MRASQKIEDIEVLRCLAVCMVFIYHAQNMFYGGGDFAHLFRKYVNFGAGVDLFFVISGFVITLGLLHSFETTRTNGTKLRFAVAFWIRRVFRIWPSSWLWLGLFLLISTFFNTFRAAGDPIGNLNDALPAIGQFANWHWYKCYAGKIHCGNNSVFWSLSLEEQFYLVLPLLFFFLRKRMAAVAFAVIFLQLFTKRSEWSLGWAFRTDALCLGVLIALFHGSKQYCDMRSSRLIRLASSWPGKIALFLIISIAGQHFTGHWISLLAWACAVIVMLASYDASLLLPGGRVKAVMVWIGGRSFAVYLIHYPVICIVLELANLYIPHATLWSGALNWPIVALAAAGTLVLANLNYRFVETPGRRLGSRLSKRFLSRPSSSTGSHENSELGNPS